MSKCMRFIKVMYKNLLLSCLLVLTTSANTLNATTPAPNALTRAIAKILFHLPFLDVTGIISAEVVDCEDSFQADIIWAIHDMSQQDAPVINPNDSELSEDSLFFEGFIDGEDSYMKIWKFNRNPDACFRIRLKLRTAAVID